MKTPVLQTLVSALPLLLVSQFVLADSAAWRLTAVDSDWNNTENWTLNTVPNGPQDVATFANSNVTNPLIDSVDIEVKKIVFNPAASPFSITSNGFGSLTIDRDGILNHSTDTQSFFAVEQGTINLNGDAGSLTYFEVDGGQIYFKGAASAGSATFVVNSGQNQGFMLFEDHSTAADSTITVNNISYVDFDGGTAGNATLNVVSGEITFFSDAEHASATCSSGGIVLFRTGGSAGDGTFTAEGANDLIEFIETSTASNAIFAINGGTASSQAGGQLTFSQHARADHATLIANGGIDGGEGGKMTFYDQSNGSNAAVVLSGNGTLVVKPRRRAGFTIGSLAGEGLLFLGDSGFTVGDDRNTTFSGIIHDKGPLTKVGTGTLTLTGDNTYTGPTTVNAGILEVSNHTGSGTGTGSVNVNAGTLGGRGVVAGAVTIGTGTGSGAMLAPATKSSAQSTFTTQGALTLQPDATYRCTAKARSGTLFLDKVVANGVTITDAKFSFSANISGTLQAGTVLTVLSNTSANPINGTFSDLADGAIITVGGTKLQANYEGGDGNDLTLTVVP